MISIEELRHRLQWDASLDEQLVPLRDHVEGLWEDATGGLWRQNAAAVYLWQRTTIVETRLWLPLRPVASITTVEERWSNTATWDTALKVDEFILDNANTGELRKLRASFKERVRVTYSAGYTDDTTPAEIKEALIVQARFMQERFAPEHVSARSKSAGQGSVVFLETADLHPHFRNTAKRHRRFS